MGESGHWRLVDAIASMPANWLLLWLGLAALTIALLVLMCTRWGQSQPLRKCCFLSLFAHALLACFATTVKIVNDSTGDRDAQSMHVTIVSGSEPSSKQELPGSALSSLWDAPPTESEEPAAEAPARVPAKTKDAKAELARRREAEPLPSDAALPKLKTPAKAPGDSTALAKLPSRERSQQPAPEIEIPAAAKRDEAPAEAPFPDLARAATAIASAAPAKRTNSDAPADSPLASDLPRMRANEVDPQERPESALPDMANLLTRSMSPVPPPQIADDKPQSGSSGETSPKNVVTGDRTPTATSAGGNPHQSIPAALQQRFADDRQQIVRQRGGGPETEAAVQAALAWLAANQELDGRWDATRHGAGKEDRVHGHDRQGAGAGADTGITGLALLAFLGAGNTHRDGEYAVNVRKAINYLASQQAADGNLAGRATIFARMYCHGMATFALSEAFAMTSDERLQPSVLAAVNYSIRSQRPQTGGWRYQPGDQGDTSQHGWQVLAMRSAELAGIRIPAETSVGMRRFLTSVTSGQHRSLASYRPQHAISRTMTAEAMYCRQLLGEAISPNAQRECTSYLLGELPGEGRANEYYWYYGTLCLYHFQGPAWEQWNEALKKTLLARQNAHGDRAGSWEPDTVWGGYGGRAYTTAMATMCLEVYYRYLPIHIEHARGQVGAGEARNPSDGWKPRFE